MKKKEKQPPKNRKPLLQLNGKQIAGWLCFLFFASGFMFVLGIFVGRGTAPVQFDIEKLQKELIALKEAVVKREQSRFKIDSDAVKNKTDLDFYEALKKPDGDDHQYGAKGI